MFRDRRKALKILAVHVIYFLLLGAGILFVRSFNEAYEGIDVEFSRLDRFVLSYHFACAYGASIFFSFVVFVRSCAVGRLEGNAFLSICNRLALLATAVWVSVMVCFPFIPRMIPQF